MKNIKLLGSAMLVSLALFSQSSLAKEYKIGASLLTQQHPGKGTVAIISYPALQSVVARVDGFKKGLSDTPDIKIVAEQPGITRAEALTTAQNIMQANANLNGLFGFGDDAALAAVIAAKSAHNDNIKIIGFDGMKEARDAVDSEKTFAAVIRQYPDQMGAKAIDAAVDHLNGKPVEKMIPVQPGVYTGK